MPDRTLATLRKTRFAQVPDWVVGHPKLLAHPTALAAYVHLALLADYKTRVSPSDWHELSDATGWSKPTVMRAMKALREAGAVQRIGDDLRLPMDPPAGVIFETEDQIRSRPVSDLTLAPLSTEVIPEKDLAAAPLGNGELFHVEPPSKATDDPTVACAHELTRFAFDQPVTPVTRGGFNSVLCRIKAELQAGTPADAIRAAIVAGDVTWTADGLRTAISRARPKGNGNGRAKREAPDAILRRLSSNGAGR